MRTSLAQFVEIERMKHRLALQQQELERTRSHQMEKIQQLCSPRVTSQPTSPPEPPEQLKGPPDAFASFLRPASGLSDVQLEANSTEALVPSHTRRSADVVFERFPWQTQHRTSNAHCSNSAPPNVAAEASGKGLVASSTTAHSENHVASCGHEPHGYPRACRGRAEALAARPIEVAAEALAAGDYIASGHASVAVEGAERVRMGDSVGTTHSDCRTLSAAVKCAHACPRVTHDLLGRGAHLPQGDCASAQGGHDRLNALITFLRRNARLLQRRRQQLEEKNRNLLAVLEERGLSLTTPHMSSCRSAAQLDDRRTSNTGEFLLSLAALPTPSSVPLALSLLQTHTLHPSLSPSPSSTHTHTHFVGCAGSSPLHFYDAVFDLQTISDVLHGGWTLRLSPFASFKDSRDDAASIPSDESRPSKVCSQSASSPLRDTSAPSSLPLQAVPSKRRFTFPHSVLDLFPGDTPVIGVLGMFNTGKTFLLNCLCGTSLPSSKKVATRGLSLRRAMMGSTPVTLLDSEGSFAPVPLNHTHGAHFCCLCEFVVCRVR